MDRRILKHYPYSELYFSNVFKSKTLLKLCADKKIFIVADEALNTLYSEKLLAHLKSHQLNTKLIEIPSGEHSKSRQMKAFIEDTLFQHGADRDSLLVALGGGVTTDLVGFVAATFYRGIPVIYLPTSLLAMVDATLGGKTGINTPQGKNLIGTFTSPKAIFIDLNFLDSLPELEYKNAFSEIIKHACIKDRHYFSLIEHNFKVLQTRDKTILETILMRSLEIKSEVVINDKHEKGLREILNFGHTIAHALEKVSDYKITHGEAVAIGLVLESYVSLQLNYLIEEDYQRIKKLVTSFDFDLQPFFNYTTSDLIEALKFDKKARQDTPRFVLLKCIGEVSHTDKYSKPLDVDWLKKTFSRALHSVL